LLPTGSATTAAALPLPELYWRVEQHILPFRMADSRKDHLSTSSLFDSSNIPDLGSRQLLAVLAIADYGSFIVAAAFLKTSQPALTRTIKRIENALGVSLFDRTGLLRLTQ
jgi:hypothetical protein